MQSCRKALDKDKLDRAKGTNASLLMARYLRTQRSEDNSEDVRNLFDDMREAVKSASSLYKLACERRDNALKEAHANFKLFETDGPMAIGLGGSNVLETGLTLNPTYGTPMIPGSSLKGITAHYCSTVLGAADPDYRGPAIGERNAPTQKAGKIYEALFGMTDRVFDPATGLISPQKQETGFIRFYDAWMRHEDVKNAFVEDVMTPHHGDYYSGKADKPTDFDDPNPVAFLTIQGQFKVWLACEESDEAKRSEWLDFVHKLVREALENYGAGGKIRAGYGRMKSVLSDDDRRRDAARAAQQVNREAGFERPPGETVMIRCAKVEINKKGKEKRTFVFEDGLDSKPPRFQEPPKVPEGTVFKAQIERIDRANNVYMLKAVE